MPATDDRPPALDRLEARFALLEDLMQVSGLLGWDQQVYMPTGGSEARGRQLASVSTLAHEKLTDPEVGAAIDELEQAGLAEDSDAAALLRLARRAYDHAVKLPAEFVETRARHHARAQGVWAEARRDDDFARFAPLLARTVELARQQADYLGYDEHPYDALHDSYEPGSSAARLRALFGPLRDELVTLVDDIREHGSGVGDAPLKGNFDASLQEQFGREVVATFGYDFSRGRLDRAVHPFAQSMGKNDVRITTRYNPGFLSASLFGTMHEAGHAMYEQGIADRYQRSPLGEAASLGVHESQSRLWENLVGRSHPFWQGAYGRLQELFPAALGAVDLERFYGAVNHVEPSFIRVEADEVTYNLHVMLRLELELALLEGELDAADLPAAWNEKMHELLGVTPPDDRRGCLQDVHWSLGLIGYFPTYTLGNLMSVQLFDAAQETLPGLHDDIRAGRFEGLLGWLREHVHHHGSRYRPEELLERATGSRLDAAPYVRYLNRKFRSLYGLD